MLIPSKYGEANGKLAIIAIGGAMTLEKIHFHGINVTPNGLEMRIYFDVDIADLRFIRTLTHQVHPEIYQGRVLHQMTGPAAV